MFYGRKKELTLLEEKYSSPKSEIAVIYGRRRIGKTALIKKFVEEKPYVFACEGVEGEQSLFQIRHFSEYVVALSEDPYVKATSLSNWNQAFSYFTEKVIVGTKRKKKFIIFFDEVQWMAAGRRKMISILKYFWDNFWKDQNVMLILCGSIASFMVEKVIHSKALYGRISTEVLLKGLQPNESAKLFKNRRSREEVLKYLLVFGGVPKYLEEINLKQSFNQNMNSLCFSVNSSMIKEIDKIFYAQFRDAEIYVQIVRLLRDSLLTHTEIAAKCGKKSGGSLKKILQHLEDAEIIRAHFTFDRNWNAKYKKYKLSDEYLTFFFKYMNPYLKTIAAGEQSKLFEMMVESSFSVWLGFAFEKFCLKHAFYLAEKMGFADQVIAYAPYFRKEDEGFQIDLIYKRVDKVITICEMKYHAKPIGVSVVKEMERKINLLKKPRGFTVEKALISLYGPDKHLESMGYFDYSLTIDDIIDGAN